MEALRLALDDVQKLARDVDGQIAPLATSAKDTLAAARSTWTGAKSLVTLTEAATPALKQAEKTMAGATTLTNPDSVLFNDLSHTSQGTGGSGQVGPYIGRFAQRNPESLLRGKTR